MKVRFHEWTAVAFYPPNESDPWPDSFTLHKEQIEVSDDPTDRDLIVAYENMILAPDSKFDNLDDIEDL